MEPPCKAVGFSLGVPPSIKGVFERGKGPIVYRRADKIGTLRRISGGVASCFENVDFTRSGPGTISVVFGEEPYGGP